MNDTPLASSAASASDTLASKIDELPDVLSRICARTKLEVEHRSTLMSLKEITAKAQETKEARAGLAGR